MTFEEKLSEEIDVLRRARDELRVQIHLGTLEARERWEQVEKDWNHLEAKLKLLRDESREPLQEIGDAARELVSEIREGYRRLRNLI